MESIRTPSLYRVYFDTLSKRSEIILFMEYWDRTMKVTDANLFEKTMQPLLQNNMLFLYTNNKVLLIEFGKINQSSYIIGKKLIEQTGISNKQMEWTQKKICWFTKLLGLNYQMTHIM